MHSQSIFEVANKKLWADPSSETSYPDKRPLVAHYTSIQVFEQIITSNEFWFSNPLFMNDLEELEFGMNEGAAEFYSNQALKNACGSDQRYFCLINNFQNIFRQFETNHMLNTYVMCFSEHKPSDKDGRLSMWRGYANGGAGVAIVINTQKLNADPNSPLIIGKVHYGTRDERLGWIKDKIHDISQLVMTHANTNDHLFEIALAWFFRLKSFSLFTKHSGFNEEQEWRVVYMSDRDPKKKYEKYFSHIATNRGIEPKLKFPIKPIDEETNQDLSLEMIVDRIILGPSISNVLGVNALKQMLNNVGQKALADRVIASEIPFRPSR